MSDRANPMEARVPAFSASDTERLLTFEYDSAMYALPIAEVHEVAEVDRICCVPTIPAEMVGVMNWHGEALPVVAANLLFEGEAVDDPDVELQPDEPDTETPKPEEAPVRAARVGHVLVLSARDDEPARLGLPIDRVLGLVDGMRRRRGGHKIIVERRPLDGRVVNVIDPSRLVARATEVIGRETT